MGRDDPEIDTAQTPKRLNGRLALQEKIQKALADSIPNKLLLRLTLFLFMTGTTKHKICLSTVTHRFVLGCESK